MPAPARQPLISRTSLGNVQKLSSAEAASTAVTQGQISRRRSSFVSKSSGIEAIIPNEDLYEEHHHQDPLNPSTPSHLAKKTSLNALNISKTRTDTPRIRQSTSSFVEPTQRQSFDRPHTRQSDIMTDAQDIAIDVGDPVEVPGGLTGTVKFLGMVRGKKGIFAGIELDKEYASRGKNDGDVDGTKYFATSIPGSGIFLPAHRATRHSSPASTTGNFPPTPTTPSLANSLELNKGTRASSQSPQTPSIPKFSRSVTSNSRPNFTQSVGPGVRAPSPQLRKPASRPSLPRPESPQRKPTGPNKFSQSLRGGRPPGVTPDAKSTFSATKTTPTTTTAPRSPSRTNSRMQDRSPEAADNTPTANVSRLSNGVTATSARPRGQSQTRPSTSREVPEAEENTRLKRELDARDKQLKEQAASLAEMESSLAELQTMVAATSKANRSSASSHSVNSEDLPSDASQLRSLLREKNEKIASLTAEFDAHRADFRSTIDTLEMASTETERVYEKRVEELLRENEELGAGRGDVEQVAQQLKALEELVAELEEGLEDARRGEAEARSEVEFLRGEVERGRSELRREREKAAKALKGAGAAVDGTPSTPTSMPDQRDDEIRGLKAIIHSLSSNPEGSASPGPNGATAHVDAAELSSLRRDMETLKRERSELQGLVERKNYHEEELEREIASLKLTGGNLTSPDHANSPRAGRHHADSASSAKTAIRPGSSTHPPPGLPDFPPPPRHSGSGRGSGMLSPHSPPDRPGTSQSHHSAAFEDASEERAPSEPRISLDTPAPLNVSRHNSGNVPTKSTVVHNTTEADTGMSALTGEGPAPGRESKVVDMGKWCALCERDGHQSVDCPFEEF